MADPGFCWGGSTTQKTIILQILCQKREREGGVADVAGNSLLFQNSIIADPVLDGRVKTWGGERHEIYATICSGRFRGGAWGAHAPPPPGAQILSISCSFWGKFGKIVCWRLPGELTPPWGNPGSAADLGAILSHWEGFQFLKFHTVFARKWPLSSI